MSTPRARSVGRSPLHALGWVLLSACSSADMPPMPAPTEDASAPTVDASVPTAPTVDAATPPQVDAASPPHDEGPAPPTYAELYDTYFAQGTPGHCANAGCHGDPGHNVWLCGLDKDTCYRGMTEVGLLKASDLTHSSISDPKRSELSWVNTAGGDMPLDAQGENEAGADAIKAWVAAGAQND